jgi:hypothetical protein
MLHKGLKPLLKQKKQGSTPPPLYQKKQKEEEKQKLFIYLFSMQQNLAPWSIGTSAGGDIHPCCPGKTWQAVKEAPVQSVTKQHKPFLRVTKLHGAESFLRSQNILSYSKNSLRLMEHQCSLSHSQQPATCPYPQPDRSSPSPSNISKIHFNSRLPSMPGFSKWSSSTLSL